MDRIEQAMFYWDSIREQRPMPSRSDLDPVDIPSLLPCVMLVDVLRNPYYDFRFRLIGTRLDELNSAHYTGWLFSDLPHMVKGNPVWEQYAQVAETGAPLHSSIPYVGLSGIVYQIEHCLMPLSTDGRNVDIIFSVSEIGKSVV